MKTLLFDVDDTLLDFKLAEKMFSLIHGLVYCLTRLIEKLIALKWEKTTENI